MKRFNKVNKKRKVIISFLVITLVGLVLIEGSYAFFQRQTEVRFINAKVGQFVANDIELAMKLDGKDVSAPPTKNSLYQVAVNCDNATGTWDKDKWGALVTNIKTNKVKCEVNFTTPGATLTNVTATSEKTTINLTYTAGGIGTSTTCVYGKTNSYGTTASGVTNSKCSISGLSVDTTYYYKVCAKNTTGQICKEGTIKTKALKLADNVKIGDYISMTPTSTSYTISKDLTGYSHDQKINPSELKLWRIIRKNLDGSIDVVSEYASSNKISFGSGCFAKYELYIDTLNEISKRYLTGTLAIDSRVLGYDGGMEVCTEKGSTTDHLYPGCPEDEGYLTDKKLLEEVYGSFISRTEAGAVVGVYLGSREVKMHTTNTGAKRYSPYLRVVHDDGEVGEPSADGYSCSAFKSDSTSSSNKKRSLTQGYHFRPVLVIGGETVLASGDGSRSSPYVLK